MVNFQPLRACATAFLHTSKGVHLYSLLVGLHGPVNRIARVSSKSSTRGGREWYTFATGDSKATACATISLMPEEATRMEQPLT